MTNRYQSFIRRFITDQHGKVVIAQPPNIPIIGWLVFTVISLLLPKGHLQLGFSELSRALLFTWAFLELTKGASYFRRALGLVVLGAVLASYF